MAVLACREFLEFLRVVIDFFQIVIDKGGSFEEINLLVRIMLMKQ